jgi:hypothetical protein
MRQTRTMLVRARILAAAVTGVALAAPAALAADGDAKEAHTAADQARARSVLLKATDLPGSGWKGEPDKSGDQRLRCASFNPDLSDLTETGDAESPTFTHSSGAITTSSANVYRTVAEANAAYDRVVRPGMLRCVTSVLQKSGSGTKVRVVSSGATAHPRRGDESRAFRIAVRLTTGGQTVPVVFDIVLVRKSRIDLAFMAARVGGAFPAATARQLTAVLDRRLAAAS